MKQQLMFLIFFLCAKIDSIHSFHRPSILPSIRTSEIRLSSLSSFEEPVAILFDCDGVIVETEELHRVAYNKAFDYYKVRIGGKNGDLVQWDKAYYDVLQNTVGGGKPKMRYYFNEVKQKWPSINHPTTKLPPRSDKTKEELLELLQSKKMEFYDEIVSENAIPRTGVIALFDQILANPSIKVGICSASTRQGFEKIIDIALGQERIAKLNLILAGDDVSQRKPHPMIYQMASERLNVPPNRCLVIEDSLIGLKAAKAAGMKCVITFTDGTSKEDFKGNGADAVFADLSQVSLDQLLAYIDEKGSDLSHHSSSLTSESDESENHHSNNNNNNNNSYNNSNGNNGNGLKAANMKRILRKTCVASNDIDDSKHSDEQQLASEESSEHHPSSSSSSSSNTSSTPQPSEQTVHQETSLTESTEKASSDPSHSVVKEEEGEKAVKTSSSSSSSSPALNNETVVKEATKKLPDDYKVYENGWSLQKLVTDRFFDK